MPQKIVIIDNGIAGITCARNVRKQSDDEITMAPIAGELFRESVLSNTYKLSINDIFNKIYQYGAALRINQKAIVQYKQQSLTEGLKKLFRFAYKIFS